MDFTKFGLLPADFSVMCHEKVSRDVLNLVSVPYDQHKLQSKTATSKNHFCSYTLSKLDTELFRAVSDNNLERVQQLLKSGVPANLTDNNGRTPLHIAASKGYAPMVKMLIERRANPNKVDNLGNTPLHLAIYNRSLKTIQYLLKGGSKVQFRNPNRSPLQVARSLLSFYQRKGNCPNTVQQASEIIRLLQEINRQEPLNELVEQDDFKMSSIVESVSDNLEALDLTTQSQCP